MKRVGLALLCIAILVLFLARGDEERPPEPEHEPVAPPPRSMPMPVKPRLDPAEEAEGIYMLESGDTRIALDLQKNREFRSLAKFPGREARETSGTWSLSGRHLTLTYRYVGGEPLPGGPKVERCRYRGNRIELTVPGRNTPVVLTKAAVIRHEK